MLVRLLPKGRLMAMNRLVPYKCVQTRSLKKASINHVHVFVNPEVI